MEKVSLSSSGDEDEHAALLRNDVESQNREHYDIYPRRKLPIGLTIIWRTVRNLFVRLLVELLPSFIARHFVPDIAVTTLPKHKVHHTSWLDGLRGAAALAVVAFHWNCFVMGSSADIGYKTDKDHPSRSNSLLLLPGLRLLQGGIISVCIFFVISGYALSVRPVQLMAQPKENAATSMRMYASTIFRRFFRLYLPLWASTVLPFLLKQLPMEVRQNQQTATWFANFYT